MVRKPNCPLQQVIRRLSEMKCMNKSVSSNDPEGHLLCKEHNAGPVPPNRNITHQYKELRMENITLKVSTGNINCVELNKRMYSL